MLLLMLINDAGEDDAHHNPHEDDIHDAGDAHMVVIIDHGEILMLDAPQDTTMLPPPAPDLYPSLNHDLSAPESRQNESNSQEKRHS